MYVRNYMFYFISQKPGRIPYLKPFWTDFSILANVLLKFGYFGVRPCLRLIVTSYVGCLYLFWYVWKVKTHSYTVAPIGRIWRVIFLSSQGVVTTLLPGKPCYRKGLGKARVKGVLHLLPQKAPKLACFVLYLKIINIFFIFLFFF